MHRHGSSSLLLLSTLAACGAKGPLPAKPVALAGHCTAVNKFSQREECTEYRGAKWTEAEAAKDCRGHGATLEAGACTYPVTLGECVLGEAERYSWIYFPGDDASQCGATQRGCEFFGGGTFGPSAVCAGVGPGGGGTGLPTFQWPELACRAPLPGEPAGASAQGQVCTWEMISGATEEGRRFEDYASCDRVRTQRPYYAGPLNGEDSTAGDPRLLDPAYATEVAWARQQVDATACVCCHSTRAPKGPSNWYVDQPGNFLNGFRPRGLAMGAGWIDTVSFGAFPAEQNNGFVRATPEHPDRTIMVTTDPARMKRLFEGELAHRGLSRADFAGQTYGAGPLDEQRLYVPTACTAGEGVSADGHLVWAGGPARYLYVLDASSPSPGVPPNLDQPQGTLWRVQVPWTGQPVESGAVQYGVVPDGFAQWAPQTGAPPPLVSGRQYYLSVLADIAIPNTRCLFTAP